MLGLLAETLNYTNMPTLSDADVKSYAGVMRLLQTSTAKANCRLFMPAILKQVRRSENDAFRRDFPDKDGSVIIRRPSEGSQGANTQDQPKPLLRGIWLAESKTFYILYIDSGTFESYTVA